MQLNKENLVGWNDYILIEKIKEDSGMIRSINNKEILSKGEILASEYLLSNQTSLKAGSKVLYLEDYAVPVDKDIYAVKIDFIVTRILD